MVKKNNRALILHIIDSLEIGGAEKLLINTIDSLPEFEHLICYLGGENKFSVINNVTQIICLHHFSNSRFFKTVLNLRKIISEKKPLLVHAHLLKSTWIGRFAAIGKCPFIFTIHNKLSEDAFKVNKLSLYFEKLTYRKNQSIIGVSNEVLKDYSKWVGIKGRSSVLYNMVENKFFVPCNNYEDLKHPLKLVAVGNLRRQKNYSNLLEAFKYLRSVNVSLDIYGGGEEFNTLQNFINEHKLPIFLKGKVDNIHEVMCQYDGFVLASIFEGYGIAVVEAMAIGLPVILSDIEVFREVTNNKAIYFNPINPESISEAIIELFEMSSENVSAFKQEMKNRAVEIGGAELFKQNLLKIYSEVSNTKLIPES